MTTSFLAGAASIVVIDLVLAGDNALIIGMAASTLAPHQRRMAILLGALLAVALRIAATLVVTHLLDIPWLSTIGGLMVLWIAVKLLVEDEQAAGPAHEVRGFWNAVRVIVLADVVMSVDNVLAIGGAGREHPELIIFGLLLSIPLVMFCSSWIAAILDRWPRLAELGAAVLGWTGGHMILHDVVGKGRHDWALIHARDLGAFRQPFEVAVQVALAAAVVLTGRLIIHRRSRRQKLGMPESLVTEPEESSPVG